MFLLVFLLAGGYYVQVIKSLQWCWSKDWKIHLIINFFSEFIFQSIPIFSMWENSLVMWVPGICETENASLHEVGEVPVFCILRLSTPSENTIFFWPDVQLWHY
jgi:hypothetical protein